MAENSRRGVAVFWIVPSEGIYKIKKNSIWG